MINDNFMDNLKKIIEPIVEEKGYELYHIEFVKEDGENYLRVYINKPEGISLNDCEKVSRPISAMLDKKDPIPCSYILEVSSPGIERILYTDKHLNDAIGLDVKVKLNGMEDGKEQILNGKLKSFSNVIIIICTGDNDITIDRNKISSISISGENKEVNK